MNNITIVDAQEGRREELSDALLQLAQDQIQLQPVSIDEVAHTPAKLILLGLDEPLSEALSINRNKVTVVAYSDDDAVIQHHRKDLDAYKPDLMLPFSSYKALLPFITAQESDCTKIQNPFRTPPSNYSRPIVVAQDEPLSLQLWKEIFDAAFPQADIRYVANGKEAQAAVLNTGADLLFSDNDMPQMSGEEAINSLRSQAWKGLGIIATDSDLTLQRIRQENRHVDVAFQSVKYITQVTELVKAELSYKKE